MMKKLFFSLILAAVTVSAMAQGLVGGKVVDQNGEAVVGVVITAGSANALSDLDGAFSISVKSFPATLTTTCLGYKDGKVTVEKAANNIIISIEEDNTVLEETVVVGYATMKKSNLVGAVEQVDDKVIGNRPVGNLSRALQGEVSGLNISFNDGKPSRDASVNVRGTSSIGAGGSTLVLIDGVEGSLSAINPQDVASVSVLKDASSTAVYGARGAFGVILVTTKSADKGVAKVSYSGSVTANRRTVIPDGITDGKTWLDWWMACYDGYYNGSKARLNHVDSKIPYTPEIYAEYDRRNADPSLSKVGRLEGHDIFGWAYYGNTDWYKELYKEVSFQTEHNLSVSGGNDKANYYVSGRFYNFDGIYKVGQENYKKFDMRAKGSIKVNDWLKVTNNTSIASYNNREPKEQTGGSMQRLMNHAAYPVSTIKNPDGTWTAAAAVSGYASFADNAAYRTNDYVYLREKVSADADIIKNVLKLSADYSFNYTTRKRVDVNQGVPFSKGGGVLQYEGINKETSYLQQVNYATRYQAGNVYLSYTPNLGENHYLNALAGYNIEASKYETITAKQYGFIVPSKPQFSLMEGEAVAPSVGGNEWAYVGFFGRVNYNYKGRYLVEASGRYDGSSKFPAYSQWGFFPSASLAWRLSEEPWMKGAKGILDNAKFRVSVGSMGNGNVSPYSYTSEMAITTATDTVLGGSLANYTGVASVVPASLTWEKATTYDAGLDLDFFNNRLSFTGDYYVRMTTDMYTPSVSLPAVYGTTPPKGNNAELRTTGWELSLMWRDEVKVGGKPFSYSVKGMLWDDRSVITKYFNDSKTFGTVDAFHKNSGVPGYYEGMEIGEIWGWEVVGLFRDADDIASSAIHDFQQASDKITRPGQLKIKDQDDSGRIDVGQFTADDHGDLIKIGNANPHYRFGINLAASWNGIGVSAFFQGVGKQDWYPSGDAGMFWGKYGRPFFAFIPSIMDMSQCNPNGTIAYINEEGICENYDTAYWPRISTYQSNSFDGQKNWTKPLITPNTRYLQNAAYIRLKTLQVDYTFPEKVVKNLRLQDLKVYVTGENLFTYTPLHKWAPNYDPEALGYDSDFGTAADGYSYPVFKNITLGVNITF